MDPEVIRAQRKLAAASRVAQLDAAGKTQMTARARAVLAERYRQRAREQLGQDADPDQVDQRAADLRRVDLQRAALASAKIRAERAAAEKAERETAELDELLAAEAS